MSEQKETEKATDKETTIYAIRDRAGPIEPRRPPLMTIDENAIVDDKDTGSETAVNGANTLPKGVAFNFDEDDCMEPPLKKAKQSFDGNKYIVEKIVGERSSLRRENDIEYLVWWHSWPLYNSTWHHKENFKPATIAEWNALSVAKKKQRYRNFQRSWDNANRRRNQNVSDKATQTGLENGDEKEYSRCRGPEYHWEEVKDIIQTINGQTNFALSQNRWIIKSILTLIIKSALFINPHKYCQKEQEIMKQGCHKLYQHLMEQFGILSQTQMAQQVIIDSDDNSDVIVVEKGDYRRGSDADSDGISLGAESDRSSDSRSAGQETDGEVTDYEEVIDDTDDYDPTEDEMVEKKQKIKRNNRRKRNKRRKGDRNKRNKRRKR